MDGVRNYTCNCTSFTANGVDMYLTGRNCGTGEKQNITVAVEYVYIILHDMSLCKSPQWLTIERFPLSLNLH